MNYIPTNAWRLSYPLHQKRASDLLSPLVGQAEKNIAAAFREAASAGAVLMVDEVDSFLQDRAKAQRPWEVTQVNEFLTQMEQFEGIFIASTNLMDGLDAAAMRRFGIPSHGKDQDCCKNSRGLPAITELATSFNVSGPHRGSSGSGVTIA